MVVGRVFLILTMNNFFSIYFAKIELFFNFETKSSLSTSVYIFPPISQILKGKFHILETQTRRNLKSIKFSNFLGITCP